MKEKITFDDFEELMNNLSPFGFEQFIYDLLSSLKEIEEVLFEPKIKDRQVDIIATEKNTNIDNNPTKWVVEIKKYKSLVNVGIIEQFYAKSLYLKIPNSKLLFITTSGLTKSAKIAAKEYEISVWNLRDLFNRITEEFTIKFFSKSKDDSEITDTPQTNSKEPNLINSLKNIDAGKKDWSNYQSLVFDILEHLFCPPLEIPHYELADLDKRNRRDIIFENDANQGFWKSMREIYEAYYIVVDAKNYSKPLSKRPIIDIAYYLKPYGCGMFGIVVSRKGTNGASEHAIKEQWIGNKKMIVSLSDEDLIEMLEIKNNSGNPEAIIRKKIANFRMKL